MRAFPYFGTVCCGPLHLCCVVYWPGGLSSYILLCHLGLCGPRLSVCLRHGTFRCGPTPRQHDRLQRGFVSSCGFASCSSCSLALVVMAAAEWGKKRGGAATQLLTPLQNVNSHGKATHTCSRCGPGLNATRQRGDACIPPLQQDCAHRVATSSQLVGGHPWNALYTRHEERVQDALVIRTVTQLLALSCARCDIAPSPVLVSILLTRQHTTA